MLVPSEQAIDQEGAPRSSAACPSALHRQLEPDAGGLLSETCSTGSAASVLVAVQLRRSATLEAKMTCPTLTCLAFL